LATVGLTVISGITVSEVVDAGEEKFVTIFPFWYHLPS
jgi:hypothetical protein